jgi:hypothetical protein
VASVQELPIDSVVIHPSLIEAYVVSNVGAILHGDPLHRISPFKITATPCRR